MKRREAVGSRAGKLQLNLRGGATISHTPHTPVTLRSSRLVQRSQWKTSFSERSTRLMRYKCLQRWYISTAVHWADVAAVRVGVIKQAGSTWF